MRGSPAVGSSSSFEHTVLYDDAHGRQKKFYSLQNNDEPIRMAGWLEKRGKKNLMWRRRYFILKGRVLHQYKEYVSEQAFLKEKPRKSVDVATCTLSTKDDAYRNTPFCFTLSDGRHGYIFKAPSGPEFNQWLEVLSTANFRNYGVPTATSATALPTATTTTTATLPQQQPQQPQQQQQYNYGRPAAVAVAPPAHATGYTSLDRVLSGSTPTASTVTTSANSNLAVPELFDPRKMLFAAQQQQQQQQQQFAPAPGYQQQYTPGPYQSAPSTPPPPNNYQQQPYGQPPPSSSDFFLPSVPTHAPGTGNGGRGY